MVFSALTQSFSFHSSPESFISSRLQDLALSDPEQLPSAAGQNRIVVASILNRKVHIVSSYQLCKDILEASSSPSTISLERRTITPVASGLSNRDIDPNSLDDDTLQAGPAYDQLMSDFFPPPNLLLQDGPTHATHKQAWMNQLSTFPSEVTPRIRQIAEKHISLLFHPAAGVADGRIDLYDMLKSLAWEVLLGIFLDLSTSSSLGDFSEIESLQETLLRGQFSLFPVSINARLWQSSRGKGIKARKGLQIKLGGIIHRHEASCPFLKQGVISKDDAANHALLFTSSLAVKALSSLLTAFALNLFLWRDSDHNYTMEDRCSGDKKKPSTSLAELVRSQGDANAREKMLRSILLETERMSPPVVGVMRRLQKDVLLKPDAQAQPRAATSTTSNSSGSNRSGSDDPSPAAGATAHPVPAGHDIWLYLSGASRDPAIFGDDADLFRFDRYMSSLSTNNPSLSPHHKEPADSLPTGLAFSAGPKTCLGTELVRQIVLTVGEVMVESGVEMDGSVEDRGVRSWLGWEGGVAPELVAKGMKQLPVQRPRVSVRVEVKRAVGREVK
jgi:cytochrome P450